MLTLAQVAQHIGADIVGPFASALETGDQITISGLGSLGTARPRRAHASFGRELSYACPQPKLLPILSAEDAVNSPSPCLVVAQPYLAFARASQLFDNNDRFASGVHSGAPVVDPTADIAASAHIGSSCGHRSQCGCRGGSGSAGKLHHRQ